MNSLSEREFFHHHTGYQFFYKPLQAFSCEKIVKVCESDLLLEVNGYLCQILGLEPIA